MIRFAPPLGSVRAICPIRLDRIVRCVSTRWLPRRRVRSRSPATRSMRVVRSRQHRPPATCISDPAPAGAAHGACRAPGSAATCAACAACAACQHVVGCRLVATCTTCTTCTACWPCDMSCLDVPCLASFVTSPMPPIRATSLQIACHTSPISSREIANARHLGDTNSVTTVFLSPTNARSTQPLGRPAGRGFKPATAHLSQAAVRSRLRDLGRQRRIASARLSDAARIDVRQPLRESHKRQCTAGAGRPQSGEKRGTRTRAMETSSRGGAVGRW